MQPLMHAVFVGALVLAASVPVGQFANPSATRALGPVLRPAAVDPTPVASVPTIDPVDAQRQTITAALAEHGNSQEIQPSFFLDLIRTMQRSGVAPDTARDVALALARNTKLDTIADLAVAGSLPAYVATTGASWPVAVEELAGIIERLDSEAVNNRFRIIGPEMQSVIAAKLEAGNRVAAERAIEQALLERFNPALAAKILVPWFGPPDLGTVLTVRSDAAPGSPRLQQATRLTAPVPHAADGFAGRSKNHQAQYPSSARLIRHSLHAEQKRAHFRR